MLIDLIILVLIVPFRTGLILLPFLTGFIQEAKGVTIAA